MLILVTGVSGSGKSEYAEQICCRLAENEKREKYYIATMKPYGIEGEKRIRRHRLMRQGKGFETIEQYCHVNEAVLRIENIRQKEHNKKPIVLIECMSNLMANECFDIGGTPDNIFSDCMKLYEHCRHLIIVTNEIFSDGCDYCESTKDYIARLGRLNTQLAECADVVAEVVYSIPVYWKGRL